VEDAAVSWSEKQSIWYTWIGWAVLFVVTAIMIVLDSSRSVVPAYTIGPLNWVAGRNLYDGIGEGGFVYFPQAALLYLPIAMLPGIMGEVVWRFVNIGVFAIGIRGLAQIASGRSGKELFPLMTLVSIPLAWDCARNGQANLIITGLMLLAVCDVANNRWWRATLWLALGVAFKPLTLVLVLLLMAIDRPMTWRLASGMIALALAPFLTQHPTYVLQQYAACLQNMSAASHFAVAAPQWTTPFSALRIVGIDVPEQVQTAIRLAAALAILALCWISRRKYDAARSAVFVFSLSILYLMLFSPRTENNTYAMLGPAIAVFLALAYRIENRRAAVALLGGLALALVGSFKIEKLIAPHAQKIWLSPIIAVCFAAYVIARLFAHPETGTGDS
jgi:hypothetical protein